MEGKRALEDEGLIHDSGVSNGTLSRNYSPRLPTPDMSRSSDASPYVAAETRRGPTVSDLLSFRPQTTAQTDVKEYGQPSDQQSVALRPSAYEERRPLLPPLKMMIANAMNSPPETPRADAVSRQPSPREPLVSASTFKPLAFYPNKKARVEERTTWQSFGAHTSSFATHADHTSGSYPEYARRLSEPSNKRHRRILLHTSYASTHCYEPDEKPYYTFTGRPNSSDVHTTSQFRARRDETSFGRFPISPSSDTSCSKAERVPYRAAPMHIDSRPYNILPAPCLPEHERASAGTFRQHAPEKLRCMSYEQSRPDYHRNFENSIRRDSCHNDGGAYFMPPHYEYSQSKSRKRSNLPKRSTEIMKTWFDNNISNPYPSEEQKVLFSNATGISMTQVSNWFINHRRRCPELREKRERVRTGGVLDD